METLMETGVEGHASIQTLTWTHGGLLIWKLKEELNKLRFTPELIAALIHNHQTTKFTLEMTKISLKTLFAQEPTMVSKPLIAI